MAAALRQKNITVSVHLVRELMAEMDLISIRVYSNYLYQKEFGKYKNHVNQLFEADAPNQIWVSDVTQFKYKEYYYYMCNNRPILPESRCLLCREKQYHLSRQKNLPGGV